MNKFTFLQKLRNKIKLKGAVTLEIDKSAKIVHCKIEILGSNNTLVIEEGVNIRNTQIEIVGENSLIHIAKECIVGHGSYLSAKEGKSLIIKEKCMLSRNVKIMTSDGHPVYEDGNIINHAKDVSINEHVWLADNVTILKGVTVGAHSIVGINATLTHTIEANSIAVGNPAKVVKKGIYWEE